MRTFQRASLFFLIALMIAEPAFAQGGTPFESILQYIVNTLTGNMARIAAVLAIAVLGYLAFVGYLTWTWAFRIIIGIVLIFGAATIADLLIGAAG